MRKRPTSKKPAVASKKKKLKERERKKIITKHNEPLVYISIKMCFVSFSHITVSLLYVYIFLPILFISRLRSLSCCYHVKCFTPFG